MREKIPSIAKKNKQYSDIWMLLFINANKHKITVTNVDSYSILKFISFSMPVIQ